MQAGGASPACTAVFWQIAIANTARNVYNKLAEIIKEAGRKVLPTLYAPMQETALPHNDYIAPSSLYHAARFFQGGRLVNGLVCLCVV